jgi:ribosomal protein L40E
VCLVTASTELPSRLIVRAVRADSPAELYDHSPMPVRADLAESSPPAPLSVPWRYCSVCSRCYATIVRWAAQQTRFRCNGKEQSRVKNVAYVIRAEELWRNEATKSVDRLLIVGSQFCRGITVVKILYQETSTNRLRIIFFSVVLQLNFGPWPTSLNFPLYFGY